MGESHSQGHDSIKMIQNSYRMLQQNVLPVFDECETHHNIHIGGDYVYVKQFVLDDYSHLKYFLHTNNSQYFETLQHAHPNILKLIAFQTQEIGLLGGLAEVVTYIQFFKSNFQDEINTRKKKKKFYTENEMWVLILNLVSACNFLQKQNQFCGDIRPCTIAVGDKGELKIIPYQIWPGMRTNYYLTLQQNQQTLLAPELLEMLFLQLKTSGQYNSYQSDVFSLGMTLLEASTLSDSSLCYDYLNFQVQKQELQVFLDFLKQNYSRNLYNFIKQMLQFQPEVRPDFFQLFSYLQPFQQDINEGNYFYEDQNIFKFSSQKIQDFYNSKKYERKEQVTSNTKSGEKKFNMLYKLIEKDQPQRQLSGKKSVSFDLNGSKHLASNEKEALQNQNINEIYFTNQNFCQNSQKKIPTHIGNNQNNSSNDGSVTKIQSLNLNPKQQILQLLKISDNVDSTQNFGIKGDSNSFLSNYNDEDLKGNFSARDSKRSPQKPLEEYHQYSNKKSSRQTASISLINSHKFEQENINEEKSSSKLEQNPNLHKKNLEDNDRIIKIEEFQLNLDGSKELKNQSSSQKNNPELDEYQMNLPEKQQISYFPHHQVSRSSETPLAQIQLNNLNNLANTSKHSNYSSFFSTIPISQADNNNVHIMKVEQNCPEQFNIHSPSNQLFMNPTNHLRTSSQSCIQSLQTTNHLRTSSQFSNQPTSTAVFVNNPGYTILNHGFKENKQIIKENSSRDTVGTQIKNTIDSLDSIQFRIEKTLNRYGFIN